VQATQSTIWLEVTDSRDASVVEVQYFVQFGCRVPGGSASEEEESDYAKSTNDAVKRSNKSHASAF